MFGLTVRTNSKEGKTPLYTRLKVEGKSIWVNLQLPVDIKEWNEVYVSERKLSNFLDRTGYSKKIAEIEFGVWDLRKRHRLTQESLETLIKNVALAEIREQLIKDEELERQMEERKKKSVKTFVMNYVDGIVKGEILNLKGKPYSKNSVKSWQQFKRIFLECYKNYDFTWDELDQSLIHTFINYLNKKEYMGETKNRHIGVFKTLITVSELQKLHNNGIARKWLKTVTLTDYDRKALIYLTKEELKGIYEAPLTGLKEQVRDLFLIGCYTSLRYDQFSKIEKGCIRCTETGTKVIRIKQNKVNDVVEIPIVNKELKELLEKYDYTVPKIAGQIVNRYIKEICHDLVAIVPSFGIKERTLLDKTERDLEKKGKLKFEYDSEGYPIKSRWELVACHTVRRTCLTQMYLSDKYNDEQIMSVSGHKKKENLRKYLRLTLDEKADEVARVAADGLF
ncbi:MAG: phage integrase SAM-like domain-containing protein [Muribaculaceae bacterium]|nr:phage integrase SAM-like domain-containing protein [Muribaculaceae bacterium]